MNRRTVLKGLAALGISATLPRRAVAGTRPDAVVIGSGIAGLSAAYDLQKAGFRVVVLEKDDVAGGRMSERRKGPLWDSTGAVGVFEANRDMYALAAELGMSDKLYGTTLADSGTIDNGHGQYLIAMRFLVPEIMNIPGLSTETRGRLPAIVTDLADIRASVDPCLLATGAGYDDESVRDYFERKLGKSGAREVLDWWVQPVLDMWGWPAETTSRIPILAWFARQEARFVFLAEGIGVLSRTLATRVPVELQTTVMRITLPDTRGRHTVHYLTPAGEATSVTPDVVVCATQGNYVIPMVEGLGERQRRFFEGIHMTKWVCPIYVLRKEHAPARPSGMRYAYAHPDPVARRTGGWRANPSDPEEERGRPTVYIWLRDAERVKWLESGKDIADYCLPLARHFYPDLREETIEDVVVYSREDVLVHMPVGFVRDLAAFAGEQERERRGLYFTGEYLGHAHTGGACAAGRAVARTIARHWIEKGA